jgi:hypothetical protein
MASVLGRRLRPRAWSCGMSCTDSSGSVKVSLLWLSEKSPSRSVIYRPAATPRRGTTDDRNVVEIVAAKALWDHSEPQLSIASPQRVQSKTVIFHSISTDFNKREKLVRDHSLYLQQA